ncbi:MAG: PAS domain S-box protein, partial [Gemmatimonadota bacterium]
MIAQNRKLCIAGGLEEHRAQVRRWLLADREHGTEYVEAARASEVLEACSSIASSPPDCLVLDDRLPDMTASQVIASLSVDHGLPCCPVIVLTSDERLHLQLLRAGAQDVLARESLTSEELVRAVDHAIERHAVLVRRNRPEVTDSNNSALFSTLIEQLPMGVYVVDGQFRLQEVNTEARPVFANVRPLIGRDFNEVMEILWGADVGRMCADIFRHTLATGERYISPPFYEQRFDLGVEQAFEWETQRIVLPDGSFGVVCYFHEITDRSLAAAALRASEERFRGLFENAPIGIAHIALDGHWLRVNDAFCAITGYSRDELTGINFPDITHPEDLEANLSLVRRALDGELSSFTAEQRYLRRDGSTVWVNLTASLLRDPTGAPLNFIAAIEDVSAKRATLEELGQQRHFVERLTAVMPGILYVYDLPAQRIVWLNQQVAAMLGYSTEEVFGRGPGLVTRVIHPEDLPRVVAHLKTVTDSPSGEVRSIEFRCKHRDGGWRWFLNYDTAFAIHADGSPHQVVGTAIDVTERKRLEEQLQTYASRLEGRVAERTAALEARAAELARSNAELEQYAYV